MTMSDHKIGYICREIERLLQERFGGTLVPERVDEPGERTLHGLACHMLFMANRIPVLLQNGRRDQVVWWLGWMQGAGVLAGFWTMHDCEAMNAPPGQAV